MRIRSNFSYPFFFFFLVAHLGKGSKDVEVSVFKDNLRFICDNYHTTFPKDFGECHSIRYIHFGLTDGFTYVGYEHLTKVKENFINDVVHDSEVSFRDIFKSS